MSSGGVCRGLWRQGDALNGRLEVRWLDFTARPVHVVEPDGRILLEGASEAQDVVLGYIPAGVLA